MTIPENLKTWEGMDVEAVEYAFKKIAPVIAGDYPDSKTRTKLKKLMEAMLPDYQIKCDEENNTFDVADSGHILVTVIDLKNFKSVDVIF